MLKARKHKRNNISCTSEQHRFYKTKEQRFIKSIEFQEQWEKNSFKADIKGHHDTMIPFPPEELAFR